MSEQRPCPLFTVVVPTRHRDDLLAECLSRLAPGAQTLTASSYDVIVTDDGSERDSSALIRERFPWATWKRGPRRGPASNRNNGAVGASGTWLVFLDDDCLPEAGWLAALANAVDAHPGVSVLEGCTLTPDKADTPFREGIENTTGGVYWSCNLAVRTDRFRQLGGFDEDFQEAGGEDMEFAHRFRTRGVAAAFVPGAVVLHPTRPVPLSRHWWKFRLGRWMRLYDLKTGAISPEDERWHRTEWPILKNLCVNQLRFTWWFVKSPFGNWRTRLFHLLFGWLMLPLNLPYQIVWHRRFRKMLLARKVERPAP
jgi:GT2 family glycosyltransferase